jgi:hypothetical protein
LSAEIAQSYHFAVCMTVVVVRTFRNDGAVDANQDLVPLLGVMAAACIEAVEGALLARLGFAIYGMVFSRQGEARRKLASRDAGVDRVENPP